MSDWAFLNKHRVRTGQYASDDSYGFNGMFQLWHESSRLTILASDGEGWQHVSVSLYSYPSKTPRWDVMCMVKDWFWEPEDVVVQFHPRKSDYVNMHKGCLHLWRCTDGREFPTPPSILVGLKA